MILFLYVTYVFIVLTSSKLAGEHTDKHYSLLFPEVNKYDRFFYENDDELLLTPLSASLG